MAGIRPFNVEGLVQFKQRINYQEILASIKNDEKVYIDWQVVFKSVDIPGQGVWESDKNTTFSKGGGLGVMSGSLVNKSENVKFSVYVFSGHENQFVADQAMNLAAQTSRMEINYNLLPHPVADMYIYSNHINESSGFHSVIYTLRNVVVNLTSSSETVDVRPFADYLLGKMASALVLRDQVPKMSPRVSVSSSSLKAGDNMWLDVGVAEKNTDDRYTVDIAIHDLPEGIEYMDMDGGKYFFNIEDAGDYHIEYTVLDTRCLTTVSGQYSIHAD